jgi:hypothetical protein
VPQQEISRAIVGICCGSEGVIVLGFSQSGGPLWHLRRPSRPWSLLIARSY